MAKILPRLYIGNELSAQPENIVKNNIDVVFSISSAKIYYPKNIYVARLEISNSPDSDISGYLDESADYIERHRSQGRSILVHCFAGLSRGPAIVIAYLIKHKKFTYDTAYGLVRFRRPIININASFKEQLRKYDSRVNGNRRKIVKTTSEESVSLKPRSSRKIRGSTTDPGKSFEVPPLVRSPSGSESSFSSNDSLIESPTAQRKKKRKSRLSMFFRSRGKKSASE